MKLDKKPKVGIFTRPIDQGISGSGSHLEQLVKRILEINDRFEIVLIHYSKNGKDIYNKARELIIPKNPLFAHFKVKRENFDILHFYPLTFLSPIWLKKPKKVTTMHGGGAVELYFPSHYGKIKRWHAKLIKPPYYRRMDFIFAGAKAGRYFLVHQYRVNQNNVYITHSAVDEVFRVYKKKPEKIKEKFGLNTPFIFHLSKFSDRKNPWTILKAFQILKNKGVEIKLVLGGKGWKNRNVVEFACKHEIIKDIIFTGFIPRKMISDFLNLADVFVFPSLSEGFGMPNLEAMACGCPVITSNAFAIPEIVGKAALILENILDPFELANKIIEIRENKILRDNLIKRGLERVKLFSWKESAQTVLDIYEKCLEK